MSAPNSPFQSNSFMALASLDQAAMDAFPEAVYLRVGNGRVLRFNQRAVALWGRTPTVGEPQERLGDSFRLYRMDGSLLHQDRCAMALALQTGGSLRDQEFVIEEAGGRLPSYFVARRSFSNASVLLSRQKRPSDRAR
jgi:PAS domain-containing protein